MTRPARRWRGPLILASGLTVGTGINSVVDLYPPAKWPLVAIMCAGLVVLRRWHREVDQELAQAIADHRVWQRAIRHALTRFPPTYQVDR